MTGIRDRLLHRLNVPTEPEHVEKANWAERVKRNLWMVSSLMISIAVCAVSFFTLAAATDAGMPGWIFLSVAFVVLAFAFDMFVVFPWGIERFDIVVPWQFREETFPDACPKCGFGGLSQTSITNRKTGDENKGWNCPNCGASETIKHEH